MQTIIKSHFLTGHLGIVDISEKLEKLRQESHTFQPETDQNQEMS